MFRRNVSPARPPTRHWSNSPELSWLYDCVKDHVTTVTTFRNKRSDNDDYGKLPEEELHNLTAAYRGILSNHSHILNRDGVYSQRGDAIEKEMRSIVEECGMILFSRIKSLEARSPNLSTAMKYAPNANEATVRDITWCWTKLAEFHYLMFNAFKIFIWSCELLVKFRAEEADKAYNEAFFWAGFLHSNDAVRLSFHKSYADFTMYALEKSDKSITTLSDAVTEAFACNESDSKRSTDELAELSMKLGSWRQKNIRPPSQRATNLGCRRCGHYNGY